MTQSGTAFLYLPKANFYNDSYSTSTSTSSNDYFENSANNEKHANSYSSAKHATSTSVINYCESSKNVISADDDSEKCADEKDDDG
jgi:hypothetical protein